MRESGLLTPEGEWEKRSLTTGEKMARSASFLGQLPQNKLRRIMADKAISSGSALLKPLKSLTDYPQLADLGFDVTAKVLNAIGYDFENHQMLDTRNDNVTPYVIKGREFPDLEFDYVIFIPGSLAPPLYGHQVIHNCISPMSEHSSVMNGPTVHTNDKAVLSAAETVKQRYQEMITYVQPGQKVLVMGHSLGGAIGQIAFLMLTEEEQAHILNHWQIVMTGVGAPQLETASQMLENSSRSGLSRPFRDILRDQELCEHFGREKLQAILAPLQETDAKSIAELSFPDAANERVLSLLMGADRIVSDQMARAPEPATNVIIPGAEHLLAIFANKKKWAMAMKEISEMQVRLGHLVSHNDNIPNKAVLAA